ncbi:MAG TPA: GNAT family N-acetyltransferase [Crocinitomicaceae bacterium]|nr:GNAT family N-acetyltransferase [Crocinitomicaceae bacterium]
MENIINPIDRELLLKELNSNRFLRTTRKGGNEIYTINHHDSPNVMREIGRLREVTFRASGGGTGLSIDIDEFDTSENCYQQLIVWSPEEKEIIGGYRYILCKDAILEDEIQLSTAHYFDFSEIFITEYLPKTIELGRSWVQPNYQPSVNPRRGLFALDNIWDGLGAVVKYNPSIEFFFGKVTMYPNYNVEARDFLLHFMHHFFPDKENLIQPHQPLQQSYDEKEFDTILKGLDFKEGFKILNAFAKERNEFVPPLVNIYMNLSPSMKTFGTAINSEFGNVEETGILVSLTDIYEEKKERYMTF